MAWSSLEEVSLYKYLGIDIHHKLSWNYSMNKRINGGQKAYSQLENNCKLVDLLLWDKKNFSSRILSLLLSYMNAKFRDVVSLENPRER